MKEILKNYWNEDSKKMVIKLLTRPFFMEDEKIKPRDTRHRTMYKSLRMKGYDICCFRFSALRRGTETKNNKKLGLKHRGFLIYYMRDKRFEALQMIFDRYPKLLLFRAVWYRIVEGVIGKFYYPPSSRYKTLSYDGKKLSLDSFLSDYNLINYSVKCLIFDALKQLSEKKTDFSVEEISGMILVEPELVSELLPLVLESFN